MEVCAGSTYCHDCCQPRPGDPEVGITGVCRTCRRRKDRMRKRRQRQRQHESGVYSPSIGYHFCVDAEGEVRRPERQAAREGKET